MYVIYSGKILEEAIVRLLLSHRHLDITNCVDLAALTIHFPSSPSLAMEGFISHEVVCLTYHLIHLDVVNFSVTRG